MCEKCLALDCEKYFDCEEALYFILGKSPDELQAEMDKKRKEEIPKEDTCRDSIPNKSAPK